MQELTIKYVCNDTSVEPVLHKFTPTFSESTRISRWRKTMSNCNFDIWIFEFWGFINIIYHACFINSILGEVPPILVPQEKRKEKKKHQTNYYFRLSHNLLIVSRADLQQFSFHLSFILCSNFVYQFINKENIWIVSKLSLSTKARQTFCFETPSLLPQVAISVHIQKI